MKHFTKITSLLMGLILLFTLSLSALASSPDENEILPETESAEIISEDGEEYGVTDTGALYPLSVTTSENEAIIFDFLINEIGYNEAVACGIMANMWAESRFSPDSHGDYDAETGTYTSYGICQWHDGVSAKRVTDMKTWCEKNGYDYTTLIGQLNYLKREINGNDNDYAYNSIQIYTYLMNVPNTADGAYDAGYYWCYNYERPANKALKSEQRGTNAKTNYWPEYCPLIFSDVSRSAWYYDGVEYVNEYGIMTGTGYGKFQPGALLSRAQFITILYRLEGSPDYTADISFADVAEGFWYTDPVLWGASAGVTTGYNDGNFRPARTISRQEFATMLYRYAAMKGYTEGSEEGDLSSFADASRVSSFAVDAMTWAVGSGIITGEEEGTKLDPLGSTTRAECATMIMRFMEKYIINE